MVRMILLAVLLWFPFCPAAPRAAEIVPLQDTGCELPPSLRDISGHALFRVTLNTSGLLEWISPLYVSTEPESSGKDFETVLTTCMQGWRYRSSGPSSRLPAVRFLVPFHYFPPDSTPEKHHEAIREEKLAFASRLMAGKNFAEIRGDGWRLRTDVRKRDRDAAVESIQFAVRAFETIISDVKPPRPSPEMTLLLFREADHFNQIAAFDNVTRMESAPAGKYHPLEGVAYTTTGGSPWVETLQTIVHECTHHLVRTRLSPGRELPVWVNEGIATYIGLLEQSVGPIDPRRFQHGASTSAFLDVLDRRFSPDDAARLQKLIAGQWSRTTLDYAIAWLVVHYILNSDDELREAFGKWLAGGETFSFARSMPELKVSLEEHRRVLLRLR